jgi:hypothetical protein
MLVLLMGGIYAVRLEMGSDIMIYIPSFLVQALVSCWGGIHTQTNSSMIS